MKKLKKEDLVTLKPHLKSWVLVHAIEPKVIQLSHEHNPNDLRNYWLITDHMGHEDSNYRIVYSDEDKKYGLEVTIEDDHIMMGLYGTLTETIENM